MVKWTENEINFLKNNYNIMTKKEIGKIINRSDRSVEWKCQELNLITIPNWSEEDVVFLKENYQNMSNAQLGKKLNRSKSAVQCKINDLGLIREDLYNYNVNFFEKIDSEEKAYWLGFIYADGYVHETKVNAECGIELSIKDIGHLKKFNKSLNGNINISTRIRNHIDDDFIKADFSESCSIRLFRKKIVHDLKQYGIDENKTYNDNYIPNIPNEYIRDFIRGYFDGDGNVFFVFPKEKQLRYTFYGVSLTLLEDIRKELMKNNIHSHIVEDNRDLYKKTVTCYRLIIASLIDTINFYDYLYNDAHIFLDRKYYYSNSHILQYKIRERANNKKRVASLISND